MPGDSERCREGVKGGGMTWRNPGHPTYPKAALMDQKRAAAMDAFLNAGYAEATVNHIPRQRVFLSRRSIVITTARTICSGR